jgi:hypothetical protein
MLCPKSATISHLFLYQTRHNFILITSVNHTIQVQVRYIAAGPRQQSRSWVSGTMTRSKSAHVFGANEQIRQPCVGPFDQNSVNMREKPRDIHMQRNKKARHTQYRRRQEGTRGLNGKTDRKHIIKGWQNLYLNAY